MDDAYALWLELRDPDESHQGRKRLEAQLSDPKSALRVVHLALQFGINLDLEAVERDIERQIAINGGVTSDTAIARFALAFIQKTPEDVANYIARYHDELANHIDPKLLQFRQIEMLLQAGLIDRASECFASLVEAGLSDAEEGPFERRVSSHERFSCPSPGIRLQQTQTGSSNHQGRFQG